MKAWTGAIIGWSERGPSLSQLTLRDRLGTFLQVPNQEFSPHSTANLNLSVRR